jgi:quinol monooxygenase YgiN
MSELHMVARFEAASGKREELITRLKAMEIATQGEPGCLYYILNIDRDDHNIFYFREGWADPSALAAHDQTPHVLAIRQSESELTANGISVIFMHAF